MLTNPADIKVLKSGIIEISNSKTRVEGERTFQSEAIKDLSEKTGMEKADIKILLATYHNQDLDERIAKTESLEAIYDKTFGVQED